MFLLHIHTLRATGKADPAASVSIPELRTFADIEDMVRSYVGPRAEIMADTKEGMDSNESVAYFAGVTDELCLQLKHALGEQQRNGGASPEVKNYTFGLTFIIREETI